MDTLRVTDASTRAELCVAIAALRARQCRLPVHFVDDRKAIADEIDLLIDRVLLLDIA